MALISCLIFLVIWTCAKSQTCPKQCDCDMENGLNRAMCVDQSLVSIDVGVPRAVQVYTLSHNVISELDNFCFKEAGYSSITILNLSFNLIFWVGIHAFAGLDHLVHLDLSSNRLRYLPSDLFWDTPVLESLDLSGNVFEALKNEPFLMHTKLQVLNLNNCRIKSLPDRLFTRLPNLKKLDLSDNYLISLKTEVLRPMRKLQRLELHSEYWQCNPEFIAVENWIASHGITYENQCRKRRPHMLEKMISIAPEERHAVNISTVWGTSKSNETLPSTPKTNLTAFERFDRDFPAVQALIIGVEIGLSIGIVGTYIWLRGLCTCRKMNCSRPQNRRQRRRAQRIADNDMRANLLWSTIVNPDLETPPPYRRQLSLPDRTPPFPIFGLAGLTEPTAPARTLQRAETPPPPYNDYRVNM